MAEVREEGELSASLDDVWKIVGDFGGMIVSLGLPVDLAGEGIGQTRTISVGSEPTVERLEERDDAAKRLVYSIVESAFPLVDYRSTMQLSAVEEGRTRLVWSSTFEPGPGASEDEACALVRAIYQGGLTGLQALFPE